MCYVYQIKNKINSKIYIGMTTKTIAERWRKHKSAINTTDTLLYRAMKKHGVENFWIEALEKTTYEELEEKERDWINKMNSLSPNGYNLTIGGRSLNGKNNPFYGKRHTEKTKKRLAAMATKRIGSANPFFGKKHAEETKKKISEKNKGRKQSKEEREMRKEINTGENNPFYGKSHNKESKLKMKKQRSTKNILQYDKQNNFIQKFESMIELEEYLRQNKLCKEGVKYASISRAIHECLKGKRKTSYGFKWKLEEGVTTIETTSNSDGRE